MAIPLALMAGAAMTGMNMMSQNSREKKSMRNQKELMDVQFRNQQELNRQGAELQLQQWKDTNFSAQMEEMKKAGLNPSLLYGMGGAGGATAGSQGGGSASGGNAPAPQQTDMSAIMGAMQTKADIDLKKAQTKNLEEDAITKAMDNQTKKNYGQDADMYEASNRRDEALQKGQLLFESFKDGGRQIDTNYLNDLNNDLVIKDVERRINQETEENVKKQIAYETASKALDEQLKKANINLTKEQERKLWHDIWQGWTNAGLRGLDTLLKGSINKLKSAGK